MTEQNWINLLIQIPLVGAFIYYSLQMSRQATESQRAFMEALDKHDEAFDKRNAAVIEAIAKLNKSINTKIDRSSAAILAGRKQE